MGVIQTREMSSNIELTSATTTTFTHVLSQTSYFDKRFQDHDIEIKSTYFLPRDPLLSLVAWRSNKFQRYKKIALLVISVIFVAVHNPVSPDETGSR